MHISFRTAAASCLWALLWGASLHQAHGQEYQTREQLLQHLQDIHHPQPAVSKGGTTDPHARMDADKDGLLSRTEWEAFMAVHDEDYQPCHGMPRFGRGGSGGN